MVRNFGERRKRKGNGSGKKSRKCKYHCSNNGSDNDYNEAGYSGARQEKVTCREVAIYVPPRNDSVYESSRRNKRPRRSADYEASAKRTADYGPTSTAVSSLFVPSNSSRRPTPSLGGATSSSSARNNSHSGNPRRTQTNSRNSGASSRNNNRRRYTYYDEDEDGDDYADANDGPFSMTDLLGAMMMHMMQEMVGSRSGGGRSSNTGGRRRGGRSNDMGSIFDNMPFLLLPGAPSRR